MTNVNASQMIRNLLVCGCVLSTGSLIDGAMAQSRSDGDRRSVAAQRDPSSGRSPAANRSDGSRDSGVVSRGNRSGDTPPASGSGGYFLRGGSPLRERQESPIPKSMESRASGGVRMTSPKELPWREAPRPQGPSERTRIAPRSSSSTPKISGQRTQVTPRSGEVNQQVVRPGTDLPFRRAPEIRTDSSRVPLRPMAQADQPDPNDRQPRRAARPDAPRTADRPRVADAPRVVETPPPANRPSVRAPERVERPSSPPPPPPATTDRPRTIRRDDAPRRGPEIANTPSRSQPPVTHNEDGGSGPAQGPANRTKRSAPVVRGDSSAPTAPTTIDRPAARSREDIGRSIARPTNIPDSSRNTGSTGGITRGSGNTAGSSERGLPISRPGTGTARPPANNRGSAPVFRSNDDVARSIARPRVGSSRVNRQPSDIVGRTNTNTGRNEPVTRSRTRTTGDSASGTRSLPVSRTRDEVARSTARSPAGTDRTITRGAPRTIPDIARTPRSAYRPGTGGAAGSLDRTSRGLGRGDASLARSTARGSSVRSASAARPDGTVRTASFRDSRTVARGTVAGRDVYVRTAHHHQGHSRNVVVINAGHYRPHRWPYGDYRGHHGHWRHGGWHHDHHHHWAVGASFSFVHSYYAPAGVFYYDVVPVAPIVYTSPVYSLNFAYVHHHGVVVSSVRYVEPVVLAPPAMVVYPTVYAAPVVAPVVYSPIVAAPVVAPVAVPVVTPVVAPVYYYYPAYAYYPVYTAVAAPAYVVEPAPAVVEAPSSGWSINTAFSFLSRSGKSFSFGGSFAKVKSAPAVVAAPAVATPAVAVEPAPVGEVQAPAPEVTLDAGLASIRANEMEKARDILSQVVVSDPENGMARMLYSAALLADGQYKEAAESLRRSFETWPDFQLKDFYLPAVYDDPKVFTKTMRDVREFLSDHPERTDAWLLVAWSYAVSGQSNEATMLLTEAQKSWPEDSTFASLDKAVQANDAAEQASASAN